ncbi:ATP-binding protein [Mycolicibacterium wolinskyi]|uniref:TraG P-loop domain-containing protein n=1 Tax=Mycolicibacterium wolinskyi TaxID=59750 RepID=A0A1X2FJA4_9MYCO|nr:MULTISPECIES: ATP-binding protein [Mycolicibacterium]MCV7286038.1 ATP-binding protein [Mycolicibacterium wolinskyi]MCV7296234.1 ATP-binding protein [Mycolicibacterium goodii]ORX18467.1 hypothetical protein AWC31_14280 [Mycolicibacterium wolinskyi]
MADYPIRIVRRAENVVYTADGAVYLNYLLLGPMFSPYDLSMFMACHQLNAELFAGVAELEPPEYTLGGFKTRTSAQCVMNRIVDGLPDYSADRYPELRDHLEALRRDMEQAGDAEIDRVFWLTVRMQTAVSFTDRLASRFFESNPHEHVKDRDVLEFRAKVEAAIPRPMLPWRTVPSDLEWVYERSRLRGVEVPVFDLPTQPTLDRQPYAGSTTGDRSFQPLIVDDAADSRALYTQFLDDMRALLPKDEFENRMKQYKRAFRSNFKSLRAGGALAVSPPASRHPEAPDGTVSYQQVLAFTSFPKTRTASVNALTEVVNEIGGADGDFMIRIQPAPEDTDVENLEELLEDINVYDLANSSTEIRASLYQAKREDLASYAANALHDEQDPCGLRVTVLVAFGSANLNDLNEKVSTTTKEVYRRGFVLRTVPGAQLSLFKSMFPCTPQTATVRALQKKTTAWRLAGFMPVRRIAAGDGMGPPIFWTDENALRKLAHLDVLTATTRGNGSIMFSGAQGSSKTYTGHLIHSWLNDFKIPAWILDPQGEWAVAVTAYDSYRIVDFLHGNVYCDPFLVFADDPDYAARAFIEWFSLLFSVRPGTAASSELTRIAQASYRHDFGLRTSRDVLVHIVKHSKYEWKDLQPVASEALSTPMLRCMIPTDEQIAEGRVFSPSARNIVFMVRGLRLPKPDKPRADFDIEERYTYMVNTAVARMTKYFFDRMPGPARFFADELASYDDQDLLSDLIGTPDREGRKFGKAVYGFSQLTDELSKRHYQRINTKLVYRQETTANGAAALKWADYPVTERLLERLITDTSPLDPDPNRKRKPVRGREGEGYFSTRGMKLRVKSLTEVMPIRAQKADSDVERMERYDAATINAANLKSPAGKR